MLFNELDSEQFRWAALEVKMIHSNRNFNYISFFSIRSATVACHFTYIVSWYKSSQVRLAKIEKQDLLCFYEHYWQVLYHLQNL